MNTMLLILDASMGSRLGTIVLKGCYVGLLFWGAVKCYEG